MDWLKQAPRGNARPDPITPHQDEAMGHAAEETIKDMRARVAQRDWTKFFA